MTHDTIILGGLPVRIEFTIQPAEPDVGISSDYVDEWYIIRVGRSKIPPSPAQEKFFRALESKVREVKQDEALETELMESLDDA